MNDEDFKAQLIKNEIRRVYKLEPDDWIQPGDITSSDVCEIVGISRWGAVDLMDDIAKANPNIEMKRVTYSGRRQRWVLRWVGDGEPKIAFEKPTKK